MSLFNKPEPGVEDRLSSAQLIGADARAGYLASAAQMEKAADDLDILAQDAQNEVDRYRDIVTIANYDADQFRRIATNLRQLVTPEQLALFD